MSETPRCEYLRWPGRIADGPLAAMWIVKAVLVVLLTIGSD